MAQFQRYIGIDYSGAATPTTSLKGLRVYVSTGRAPALEVPSPPGTRKYWTRQGIAYWLEAQLSDGIPTLVGMDHGFSFPVSYFHHHGLALDWPSFLDDFHLHWPTDEDNTYVDFIRKGTLGNGQARMGDARWRRACEIKCRAKSVFHFDVQGSVAKSTHAGLPWLRHLRKRFYSELHFWPFDGWDIPANRSAILEAYPALYKLGYATEDRTPDQHDAYAIASWLSDMDASGDLSRLLTPGLPENEQTIARVEGWILGVS